MSSQRREILVTVNHDCAKPAQLLDAVDEWKRTEQSIKDRIADRRESMTKFGGEDYYRNQIAMEEELLSKFQDIRRSDEAFLVELKES